MSAEKIISDWKSKKFKPYYWLEGDEAYYIDKVIDYAEHHLLTESEASFNLTVFYGRDADWTKVINACTRYPMFAERQVVLLKEAQHMKDIEKLESYISKPMPTTIFVVGFKEGKLDGRKGLSKKLAKAGGEVLQTKKMLDYQMPDWVKGMVKEKGYDIAPNALQLLIDHIGNDLNRLENEVDKVCINLGDKKLIDADAIDKFVGISKEFNAFELQAAVGKKDIARAIRIIQYFKGNPKAGAIQMVLPAMYGFFSKVLMIFEMADKSENSVKSLFSFNIGAARDGLIASKMYGYEGVEKILLLLHEYNLRAIGINDGGTEDADLMKEMVIKMIS